MAEIWAGVLPRPRMTSGKPLPDGAMVIDPGEAQILERAGPKRLDQLIARRVGVELAARDLPQEILEPFV